MWGRRKLTSRFLKPLIATPWGGGEDDKRMCRNIFHKKVFIRLVPPLSPGKMRKKKEKEKVATDENIDSLESTSKNKLRMGKIKREVQ